MTTVLWWLLQNTLTVALLVAIVAAVSRLLKTRPAMQHALWLVVLVKFVTPPIVAWPWTARNLAASFSTTEHALNGSRPPFTDLVHATQMREPGGEPGGWGRVVAPRGVAQSPPPGGGLEDSTPATQPIDEFSEIPIAASEDRVIAARLADLIDALDRRATTPPDASDPEPVYPPRDADFEFPAAVPPTTRVLDAARRSIVAVLTWEWLAPLVFGVWLLGGLATAVAQSRRLARQWRLVRGASEPPPQLASEVGNVASAMHVRPIPTRVARGIASPFIWCVGWLRLLWPEHLAGAADVARCRGVIAHELAHVRRRDHWVAWLELVAGLIWWWNPLFWFVRSRLREAAEMACDAMALSVLPDGRREYAEAFLELSVGDAHRKSIGKAWAPAPVLGMSTGARRTFKRRFAMMLSDQVRSKMTMWGFLAVGLLALVTLPSWSLGQAPSPGGQGSAPASSENALAQRSSRQ